MIVLATGMQLALMGSTIPRSAAPLRLGGAALVIEIDQKSTECFQLVRTGITIKRECHVIS
jgi:hypothetical protein